MPSLARIAFSMRAILPEGDEREKDWFVRIKIIKKSASREEKSQKSHTVKSHAESAESAEFPAGYGHRACQSRVSKGLIPKKSAGTHFFVS